MQFTPAELAQARRKLGLPADADTSTIKAALMAASNEMIARLPGEPKPPTGPRPWGDGDPVQWAYDTDRIVGVDEWHARHAADPAGVEQALPQLTPVPGINKPAGAGPAPVGGTARSYVDELRHRDYRKFAAASAKQTPPRLFGSSDTPRATVSGVDGSALAGLPWQAAIAATYEPDRAKVVRIINDFSGEDAAVVAAVEFGKHPDVLAHQADAERWLETAPYADADADTPITDAEIDLLYPPHMRTQEG